jgi:acyl-CoA reductase-like NAD-dependent aldehyde dehydrogenase
MGKVRPEAGGDVQEAIDMTYYMAGEGRRLFGHTTPSEMPNKFQMSVRMPVGVVGAITPWNFPIAIPSWKIAPALVCGDTVVFKPARDTPMLGERFVEIFEEAGLPAGVLNIVHGGGETVGERLVAHPDVPLISLTGSREVGVRTALNAAPLLKHVHLELGGKNAIIVMDDADLELAVDGIIWSAFGTSGQRCTAASRVIAGAKVYDSLQSQLVARAEKLRLGNGLDEDTEVGPVINKAALEKIHSYTEIGKHEGAKLLTGGEIAGGDGLGDGTFYRPTIFGDVDPQMRVAQEEIFGPVVTATPFEDEKDAVRIANDVRYGLMATVWTGDPARGHRLARRIKAGTVGINMPFTAFPGIPFGGYKQSGFGRELGLETLDAYLETKSVIVSTSPKPFNPFGL